MTPKPRTALPDASIRRLTRKKTKRKTRARRRQQQHELTPRETEKALAILEAEARKLKRIGRVADRRDRKRRLWEAVLAEKMRHVVTLQQLVEDTP